MKNTLRVLSFLAIALLGGCCANDTCNCDDLLEDALFFKLDPAKFTQADLDTIYFQRFALPDTTQLPIAPDTATRPITVATIIRSQFRKSSFFSQLKNKQIDTTNLVVLANTYPFSPLVTAGNISRYRYKLLIREGNTLLQHKTVDTYDIRNVVIRGRYNADGCCTCYQNTGKRLKVNNGPLTVINGNQVTTLTKP